MSGMIWGVQALLSELLPRLAPVANLLEELHTGNGAAVYGVLVLILVLGACLVPIPEEAAFAIGGALAARGSHSWLGIYAAGWITVLLLDLMLFSVGRRTGSGFEQSRWGRQVGSERWARMRGLVERRGAWGVAGARFVMGARVPVFLMAGALGMPRARFIGVVAVAGLFSAGLPLLLGYVFGAHLEELLEALGNARWVLLGLVALLLFMAWGRRARS